VFNWKDEVLKFVTLCVTLFYQTQGYQRLGPQPSFKLLCLINLVLWARGWENQKRRGLQSPETSWLLHSRSLQGSVTLCPIFRQNPPLAGYDGSVRQVHHEVTVAVRSPNQISWLSNDNMNCWFVGIKWTVRVTTCVQDAICFLTIRLDMLCVVIHSHIAVQNFQHGWCQEEALENTVAFHQLSRSC